MKKIDLLIFDLDGTLVDSRHDLANSVNHARNALDLPSLELNEIMNYVGDGLRRLMERSLPESHLEKIDPAITFFRSHYRDHLLDASQLYSGVEEILNYYQNKKMAVISNKPEEFTRQILQGLGVGHEFKVILGGDSLPVRKPDPEPIFHILNRLEVPPKKAVIIGDGATDIQAGKQAGIFACAVTYGFKPKEVLQNSQPDFMVDAIHELKEIFE